jgi:hypothetical protein
MAQNREKPVARHEFVSLDGQRYACIRDVDRLEPFLMSIVGNSDVWLFLGSNSPFTAGRVDPDHAMFPYQTADKILRHADGQGASSVFRVRRDGSAVSVWEPWRADTDGRAVTRNLYKHVLGTSALFEEIDTDLGLRFTWSLSTCEEFGLVRHAVLENIGAGSVRVDYLDGYQMLLPSGVTAASFSRLSAQCGNRGQAPALRIAAGDGSLVGGTSEPRRHPFRQGRVFIPGGRDAGGPERGQG